MCLIELLTPLFHSYWHPNSGKVNGRFSARRSRHTAMASSKARRMVLPGGGSLFEGMSVGAGAANPPSREQPHGYTLQQEPSASPVADANGMFSGLDMAGGKLPLRSGYSHGSSGDGAALQRQLSATRGTVDMFAGMDTGFQDPNFTAMTAENHSAHASAASLAAPPPNGSGTPHLSPTASDAAPKLRNQQEGATTARRTALDAVLMIAKPAAAFIEQTLCEQLDFRASKQHVGCVQSGGFDCTAGSLNSSAGAGMQTQALPPPSGRRKRPSFRVGYARTGSDAEAEGPQPLRTTSSAGATGQQNAQAAHTDLLGAVPNCTSPAGQRWAELAASIQLHCWRRPLHAFLCPCWSCWWQRPPGASWLDPTVG